MQTAVMMLVLIITVLITFLEYRAVIGTKISSEECRLLGYKNSVRTSHETPYVSTTESSQLMLCKI
jgi:hypothetical protein